MAYLFQWFRYSGPPYDKYHRPESDPRVGAKIEYSFGRCYTDRDILTDAVGSIREACDQLRDKVGLGELAAGAKLVGSSKVETDGYGQRIPNSESYVLAGFCPSGALDVAETYDFCHVFDNDDSDDLARVARDKTVRYLLDLPLARIW